MAEAAWISHNDARQLVGKALYREDWIGALTAGETELLYGEQGPKRHPRPRGSSGFFEIIAPCPSPAMAQKLDAVIGRDRRMIIQLTTVLEWLDQSGFPALAHRYPRKDLERAVDAIATTVPVASARGKRGPAKGSIARFAADDRSKFPQMKRLMDEGLSASAAASALADQLKGGGTLASRATRLRKLFQAEAP